MELLNMYNNCRFQWLGEDRLVSGQIAAIRGMLPENKDEILLFGCQNKGQLRLVTKAIINGREVAVRGTEYSETDGVVFRNEKSKEGEKKSIWVS